MESRRRSSAGLLFAALLGAAAPLLANAAPSQTLERRMGGGLPIGPLAQQEAAAAAERTAFTAPSFDTAPDQEHLDAAEKAQWKRKPSMAFRAAAEKRSPPEFHPDVQKRWTDWHVKRSNVKQPRAAASTCLPANATDYDINYLFYSGGANYKVQLCPNTVYYINDTIYYYNAGQELSTQGYPTDNSRATIQVMGNQQSVAIYMVCPSCTIKNIQLNGNRAGLGRLGDGSALIEMGGPYPLQAVTNSHIYDPRGWSALHIGEGACNDGSCQCTNIAIQNNQVGPAGDSPNSSWQFKRSMAEVDAFMNTPNHVLRRDGATAPGQWADGISLACSQSQVTGNVITDATDGMIVIFEAPGSVVSGNTLIVKNKVALGGIGMVDYNPWGGNFQGVQVTGNTLRTDGSMMKIGIPMGPLIWGTYNNSAYYNQGGVVSGNKFISTGGYFTFGISTGGYNSVTVSGNDFSQAKFNGAPSYACLDYAMPPAPQALVKDPYTTTGSFQAGTNDASLCLLPCMMACEYSDQGCTWPAWYQRDTLTSSSVMSSMASSTASSAASSASSSIPLSSSTVSKATSSSQVVSSSSTKTSSSVKSTAVVAQVPTSTIKSAVKTVVAQTTAVKKPATTQKAQPAKATQQSNKNKQKTSSSPAKKVTNKVTNKASTQNWRLVGKRDFEVYADESSPNAGDTVFNPLNDSDSSNTINTQEDAAPEKRHQFLDAAFGRSVYEKRHLVELGLNV